jgi:hypothetical protein
LIIVDAFLDVIRNDEPKYETNVVVAGFPIGDVNVNALDLDD